jgi:hypothetical protein
MMAGPVYFALVFAAGFVFGVVRVLLVVPQVGVMWAELMEAPLMLVVIVLAARWTVRRFHVAPTSRARIGMGLVALGLLLCAELTLVLGLRGLSIAEYVASREPVSGTVYILLLVLFAAMPALLARGKSPRR